MIPIYAICGIAYGMVELIRRIIPRDIVGGNVQKLRKMDSIVRPSLFWSRKKKVSCRGQPTNHRFTRC